MYEASGDIDIEKKNSSPLKNTLKKIGGGAYDTIETLIIALAIVVFIYLFLASPHEVVGKSMEPNFYGGEYLLADKVSYKFRDPERGEVVIFKFNDTQDFIKRVIAIPGDTIEIRDGHFYVNGELVNESEYLSPDVYTEDGSMISEGTVQTVPDGEFFLAGDNRMHSSDSRTFGTVEKSRIKGRALFVYWPFSHFKVIHQPKFNLN